MKRRNNISKIVIWFVLFFTLVGCMDRQEIERQAYVVAIGLDKGEEEGTVRITYLISNPEYGSEQEGGGSTSEPPVEIISFEGNDVITARNKANAVVAKQISYDLLRTFIASEEFARDKNFIRWMYDATKDSDIRRDGRFIVSKENAFQFIQNNKPNLETRPHRYFDIILRRGIQSGLIPDGIFNHYFRITEADADLFLAIYGTSEEQENPKPASEGLNFKADEFSYEGNTNPVSLAGAAVFKEGRMIDTLTVNELRVSIFLNNELRATDMLATFQDPIDDTYRIATRVKKNKDSKITMDLKASPPNISVDIPLTVEVLTDHSMVNYATHKDKRDELKQYLEKELTKQIETFIKKTQKEYRDEPFNWSLEARKHFRTIPKYEAFKWREKYPDMQVDVKVDIEFGEFGRQSKLPNLEGVRD